jgi:prepilin-type N-terminal cleavage/methylation domain-containing protein
MLYFKIIMKRIKGLTLIELIISIIIVSVISVASFEFFRHCQRFIVDAEIRLGAANFARETMELSSRSWDAQISDTAGWQPDTPLPTGGGFGRIRDDYGGTREYRVQDGSTGEYKVIEVKVDWNP